MRDMKVAALALFAMSLPAVNGNAADVQTVKPIVVETYPHDAKAYTQGLFFRNGILYESTGQNGRSSMRKVDLRTGKPMVKTELERKYFGEGSAIAGDRLYMLTWTNGEALVFDPASLRLLRTVKYPREGWGLAALPAGEFPGTGGGIPSNAVMVASDGSAFLYFLDVNLSTLKTVRVTMDGRPVRMLNELEWIDGKIWANVYTTDVIVVIDPCSGVVERMIDCSDLLPETERGPDTDVLNGIAVDSSGAIYLTGKNWPRIFKVTFR